MAPPAGITVRAGSTDDLADVVRLENSSFTDPWSPAALAGELVADALRLPLVAVAEDVVVGYLMAWRVADQLHVLNIAADTDRRRQGVGTALLREAAEQGLVAGLRLATLEVRRSNDAARDFYRAHGFAETGVRKRYYGDNGEDAIVMDCALARLVEP
jgi:ribosomal-protein-alanine N-acetyltransferase